MFDDTRPADHQYIPSVDDLDNREEPLEEEDDDGDRQDDNPNE